MKYYYQKSLEKILDVIGKRKIIMYGTDLLSGVVYQNLAAMGKDVAYFVSDSDEKIFYGKEVKPPYDLLYESREDVYIIAFALEKQKEIYQTLKELGFSFKKDFCICGLAGYIADFEVVDSLLGFSRKYDEVLGFWVYGNPKDSDAIRILTLGGSTSDPTIGNYKSWPEQLYDKIRKEKNVVVFSGGMGGYSIHQEFFKFVRDGLILKPDIVITFDGYNDAGFQVCCKDYPLLHRYQEKFYDFIEKRRPMAPDTLDMRDVQEIVHGLKRESCSDVQNWVDGVRKIYAVAKEFGIRYFGFFQPMIPSGKAIIDDSILELAEAYFEAYPRTGQVYERIPEYAKKCQDKILNMPYITDLSTIFDYEEDVYYDICHSTDKGNKLIMEHIYNVIKNAAVIKN